MNKKYIKNNILKQINFQEIDKENEKFKYYKKDKEKHKNQYNLNDIINIEDNSNLTNDYIKLMKDFNTNILYKSDGHGINHNIRVCYFAYIISTNEGISNEDFKLVIEACKYHDIGRENDIEDESHGKRSAEMLTFLRNKYTEDELNYIKTITTCHSLDDTEFEGQATKNKIKNIPRCKKMHEILKDSDALDRVRLDYPFVDIKYLRTETSKKLIVFSHELFYNYNKLLSNN